MEFCAALDKKDTLTCYNINQHQEHHATRNKPDTKGEILYDSTYMIELEQADA